jgi:predicted nucleotidyltransferase
VVVGSVDVTKGTGHLLIVPVGTQVVRIASKANADAATHVGSVGVITVAPVDAQHAYRVHFADGDEIALSRGEFTILKQHQRQDRDELGPHDDTFRIFRPYVAYRCVVGSRAYGLVHERSDVDLRGFYLPPAELEWSLSGVPEQIEHPEDDEVYWELQKFLVLALKANPNVLECLYTPLVEEATELALELRALRSIFLSCLGYQSYGGYVFSQFRKLEQDLRTDGTIRWKHAMHLMRLLLSGITMLREGYVPVDVGEHRDRLLAIGQGQTPWDEVNAWRLALHKEFDAAFAATSLPHRPNYEQANAFLLRARMSRV